MLSRLKTKVFTKTLAHETGDCIDPDLDLDFVGSCLDDGKHVISDVKMATKVDKCLCGSPRLTTGSSKRVDAMTSLNRKLDPTGCMSTRNEYTWTTGDNRKTSTGHARKEEVNNVRNALYHSHQRQRLPSSGMTSSYNKPPCDSDDDSDIDMSNRKWKDEEKGCSSNYTALNYDVNYVRVSPPKMTRRLKPQLETEVKITREAQLAAIRATASREGEAGTQPPENSLHKHTKTPPVKPRTVLRHQREHPPAAKFADQQPVAATPAEVDSVSKKEMKATSSESDYIALSDLQASLSQSAKPEVDKLATKPELVSVAEVDDSRTVAAKMISDGENSFLQLTFTVKLDNSSVTKSAKSTADEHTQDAPVLSGTVNIVKSAEVETSGRRKDATFTVKPVVTVQGGVVIGREKQETPAGSKLANKPVGIAGIQLTQDDNSRRTKAETGSRPSSAGTQRSTHDHQQVCNRVLFSAYLNARSLYWFSVRVECMRLCRLL